VEEARRRIAMILDPPTPEVGATYQGRVVNIAKFGAFVSIMPGRDGLLHISKMAPLNGGKRIGQVEDVLELGQAIEVKVDDIDPQGKVSLSLVGDFPESEETLVLLVPVTRTAVIEVTVATEAVVTVIVGRASARRARTPTIHAPARRRRPSKRPSRPNSQAKSATWALVAPAFVDGDSSRRSPRPRRR